MKRKSSSARPMVEDDHDRIASIRNEHIGRLFMISSRVFEKISLRHMAEMGFNDLRIIHLAFLRNVGAEGSRLTEIAEHSNMTKQAAGQLAYELEELGYLSREQDPEDGRARIMKFTGRGRDLFKSLPKILEAAEKEIAEAIGINTFTQIKLGLHLLVSKEW